MGQAGRIAPACRPLLLVRSLSKIIPDFNAVLADFDRGMQRILIMNYGAGTMAGGAGSIAFSVPAVFIRVLVLCFCLDDLFHQIGEMREGFARLFQFLKNKI